MVGLAASVLASPSRAAAIGGKKEGGNGGAVSSVARTGPVHQTGAGGDVLFLGKGSGGDWLWLIVLALFIFAFVRRS